MLRIQIRLWLRLLFVIVIILSANPTAVPRVATAKPAAFPSPHSQLLAPRQQDAGVNPAEIYNPFVQLFPEVKRLAAPTWLREGLRTTYYVQSATFSQDPDEGSGGAGYRQYDLVALDRRTAVASATFYLDAGNGVLNPSFTTGMISLPGAGDYWLHPTALADAERVANDELIVMRMPTTIGGESYEAVRFEYHGEASEYVWMFDEVSGLLLFYRHAIGEEDAPRRQLADMTLVNSRQVRLPWSGSSAPDWADRGLRLRFEGAYTARIPGGDPIALPYGAEARINRAQPRWTGYTITDSPYGGLSNSIDRVAGVNQLFGALWLPEEALTARVRRPLLDVDPVTGSQVTYQRSGDTITLTETGANYESRLVYDASSGLLLASRQQTQVGIAVTVIELQLVE